MTVREFCMRYQRGDFRSKKRAIQIEAGWRDWFCDAKELAGKLAKIWEVLKGISSDYILNNYQVAFSNHCCATGILYDCIGFEPLDESKENELTLLVDIDSKRSNFKYEIITSRSDYSVEARFNNASEVSNFINEWEIRLQDKSFYEKRTVCREELNELISGVKEIINEYDKMVDNEFMDTKSNVI